LKLPNAGHDEPGNGRVPDFLADIRDLDLPDRCVDEIFTSNTIDRYTRWTCFAMLRDWHRILKPGGKLVIETADFRRCVLGMFHLSSHMRQSARARFYGNQRDRIGEESDTTRYVWSARDLRQALLDIGFRTIELSHRVLPGVEMRLTAMK
jgi:ubiquinone/menaquinone biosynthesis C-methylase UbiE